MTAIPDDKLFEHADRLKDKVVIITGAANGIGKEAAMRCAAFGAKVVIGDMDVVGAQKTVQDIESLGGQAISLKCDVRNWEHQVAMFDLAMSRFGSVDVVIPNAGVGERGTFLSVTFDKGKPVKPNLKTIEVNLIGVLYTSHLAMHYLTVNRTEGSLKALVLQGSVASWVSVPFAPLYAASKHAVLGLMRTFASDLESQNIRVGSVHSFFANTGLLPLPLKVILAGIPLTPVPRVAGAIIYAATNPDPAINGSAWTLMDDGPVFMLPKEELKLGVYKVIDERYNSLYKFGKKVRLYSMIFNKGLAYFWAIPLMLGVMIIYKAV